MKKPIRIPFRNLDREGWERLALVALVVFYLLQIGSVLLHKELFSPMGEDFLGLWSTGRIATMYGYSHIYDLPLLENIQRQQLGNYAIFPALYNPMTAAYFPFFILPFQLLSFLNLWTSFSAWTIINGLGLFLYLVFLISRLSVINTKRKNPWRVLIFLLLSYPVFQNFYWGQVNVFLLICCGEFIRNALANKPLASGLWLGGLLIKPLLLVLVLPALLLLKNWRLLFGFIISSAAVIGSSMALAGVQGMQTMFHLWLNFLPGITTNAPEVMANWRMLGLHLGNLTFPEVGWTVIMTGMAASLLIWYLLWRRRPAFGSSQWVMMMAGIFSISCAFAWHSHIHMMMVIIPFLVYSAIKKIIPEFTYEIWTFAIPIAYFLILIMTALASLTGISFSEIGALLFGSSGLALNIWISLVMLKHLNQNFKVNKIPL